MPGVAADLRQASLKGIDVGKHGLEIAVRKTCNTNRMVEVDHGIERLGLKLREGKVQRFAQHPVHALCHQTAKLLHRARPSNA